MALGLDHNRMKQYGAVIPRYDSWRPTAPSYTQDRNLQTTTQLQQEELEEAPQKWWWEDQKKVEDVRYSWLTNSQMANKTGVSPQILNNSQLFGRFAKLQQQYIQKALAGVDVNNPGAYELAVQQAGQQLSADILAGKVQAPPDTGLGQPQGQGASFAAGAPATGGTGTTAGPPDTSGTGTGTAEPPAVTGGEETGTAEPPTDWEQTAAGQQGWTENNQYAGEYNTWQQHLDTFNELADLNREGSQGWFGNPDLVEYFKQYFTYRWDSQKGHMFWVERPDGHGGWYRLDRMEYVLRDWTSDLWQKANEIHTETELWQDIQDYVTGGYQYDVSDITQEFQSEWTQMLWDVFGDLGGMPGANDYIRAFLDMYPITDFSPEALPGTTDHERRAAFFEALKKNGIDISDPERYKGDEGRQQFLNDLRDMALRLNPDTFFQVDDASYEKLKQLEIGNLITMIERKSTMTEAEIQRAVSQMMAPAERQAVRDLERRLSAHAAAGRAYSGAVARTTAQMHTELQELRLGKSTELFMQSIRDAEAGRISAIQQLGQIRQSDLTAMLEKAKLRGTLAADWLEHMAEIGRISLGEEELGARVWEVMGNQRLKVAEIELNGQLQLAGLDLEQYRVDVGYDTQRMMTELERAYRQQGLSLEAAKFKAQQVVNQWDAAATMANLAQRGDFDKLVAMADLALKAQQGDMDAWAQYQKLVLQEKLSQRGMDITSTEMIADIMTQLLMQKEQFNFEEWRTRYWAQHEKDMLKMKVENSEGGFLDFLAGIAPGIIEILGGFISGNPTIAIGGAYDIGSEVGESGSNK